MAKSYTSMNPKLRVLHVELFFFAVGSVTSTLGVWFPARILKRKNREACGVGVCYVAVCWFSGGLCNSCLIGCKSDCCSFLRCGNGNSSNSWRGSDYGMDMGGNCLDNRGMWGKLDT